MSRGSHGTYAPLASTVRQGDDIALESVPARGEHSPPVHVTVLTANKMGKTPVEPHPNHSSRPQISSPLLNSASPPDNPPNNYSENGTTQAEVPSRFHREEPFVTDNTNPSLLLEVNDVQRHVLHPEFNSKRQFWELFRRGLKRFILTLVLAVMFMYTIKHFSNDKVMSHKKKSLFNAIITGSSMVLGMSITEGFKCMAVDIRWWILSRKKRRLSEVDKILRADSLTVLGELFMTYIWRNVRSCHLFRDWGLILGIAIWWVVNVSAQVAIASVGLTYSVDQLGSIAQTKQGFVLLPNMTQIFPVGIQDPGSTKAQQNTANSFGNMALSFGPDFANNIPPPGTLLSSINALFFWSIDENSGVFVFIDSSPSDPGFANYTGGPSAMFTNRKINSTYSCLSFPVIGGGNGTVGNLTVLKNSNEDSFNVFLPIVPGLDTTTYFTNPVSRCGDGCSIVEAFEASHNTSWYYQCNITVGTVVNAMIPEHEVGLNLREMASGGIALQGYGPNSHLPESKQFQVYPSASPYGVPQKGDTDNMGRNIALFAIGVVSMAALYTSHTVNVTGLQPHIGHELKVNHWNLIWIIMGLIVGVQGAAFVLTAFWANRVVVKDESALATARLLRPVLGRLGDEGTTMNGKKICNVLDAGEERRYIYTVPKGSDEPYRVELGDWPRCRSFPEGIYN